MRGKHATKPIEEVVAEARELAADGVRELIIVAQDTTYYGMDLYGEPRLAELLRELEQGRRARLDSADVLLPDVLHRRTDRHDRRQSKRIVPYLDMPLQHINDTMLRRMQRRVNRGRDRRAARQAARADSEPGDADHVHHRLSRRDGRAVRGAGRVRRASSGSSGWACSPIRSSPTRRRPSCPITCRKKSKNERRERLMAVQQEVAFAWNEAQIGRQLDVLIDSAVPGEKNAWIGRSYADAPDVDGVVYVTGEELAAGAIVPCEIVATQRV